MPPRAGREHGISALPADILRKKELLHGKNHRACSGRYSLAGAPLPGNTEPVWRYTNNPIIERDAVPRANSIFNSAVVPFRDGYAGVFRVDDTSRLQTLHRGFSKDGIHWELDKDQIAFISDDPEVGHFVYGYDPRVCFMDGRYYVTWCNGYHGPTIGMAYTEDFEKFYQMENLVLPYNRNGVLFPRKINGRYYLLSRPSDKGHTPFGDIFISESPGPLLLGKASPCNGSPPGVGRHQNRARACADRNR